MQLSALKTLKKPGSPPAKLKFHQKVLRSIKGLLHTILNGSSNALSKAVIFLAVVEVRALLLCRLYLNVTHATASASLSVCFRPPERSGWWRSR